MVQESVRGLEQEQEQELEQELELVPAQRLLLQQDQFCRCGPTHPRG